MEPIVNDNPLETPPPGAGFATDTVAVPGADRKPAGIAALSSVALTNVVTQFVPFHWTCEAAMNPLPLTDNVNAPELMTVLAG